jgi:hypothetical protein
VFTDLQQNVTQQGAALAPDAWANLISPQSPVVQTLMGGYLESSKAAYQQVQDQMLAAMGLRRPG